MIGQTLDTVARAVATPLAAAMFANQLEDLFVDLNYFVRGLHRRAKRHVSLEALRTVDQRRTAILVPAWQEADVIQQMLDHNLSAIDYDRDRFEFFIGTYANDPATQARVDEVAARDPAVHKVVVPHEGPTSKADCLNWVWQGIVAEERRRGIRYDILLMHDAEDVIHPLSLRLYSLLIPKYEFVQSPVFSLPRELTDWVGATYVDEFAEHHLKEMAVRDVMGGLVPSAGVGSAFDRDAFEDIALASGQRPFDPNSLTEDYEIGLKFRMAGKRVLFACHSVEGARAEREQGRLDSPLTFEPDAPEEFIATREYFPSRFKDAVRQRSRWVVGITMQAWESWGWKGNAATRWCLWRDRKALLTYPLLLVAYALFAYVLARDGIAWAGGTEWDASAIVAPGSITWFLVLVNTGFLCWRAALRFHFVRQLHGARHGLLSLPRLVVNNLVGVAAMARATRQWLHHRATGEPLRWLKTAHVFPTAEALGARRQRLGEILVARQAVATGDVDRALEMQRVLKLPIGEVFSGAGFATARGVVRALGSQLGLPSATIDASEVPVALLGKMSEADAERLGVLPLGREKRTGPIRVATARPLGDAEQAALSQQLGGPVAQVLTLAPDLSRARSVAYRRARHLEPKQPRLGDVLVGRGVLSPETLKEALDEQSESGEMLAEVLLRHGVPLEELSAALAGIAAPFRRVAAGDGDPEAVAFVRYGFCAIHGVVPLTLAAATPRVEGARVVAAAYPLHRETERALKERLGAPVEVVLAPMTDVRFALAIAAKAAVRGRALRGADGAELAVVLERGICTDPAQWMASARSAGVTPIDWAEQTGAADASAIAEMRAEALGLPLAAAARDDGDGILPPRLVARGVQVVNAAPGQLVLATSRPDTALTREVARALPGWRIAWQVATPNFAVGEERDHAAA